MKKLISLLLMSVVFILIGINVQAQTTTAEKYLTPEQRAIYEADKRVEAAKLAAQKEIEMLEKKLETYGNWVGVGGEIGTAVKDGLNAVVDVADKFGATNVGKFTMVMVAWKIMGKDIVKIFLGLLFFPVMIWLIVFSFKRTCLTRKILTKYENPGFLRYPKKKEFELVEPLLTNGDGLGFIRVLHLALGIATIWITYAIMFTG